MSSNPSDASLDRLVAHLEAELGEQHLYGTVDAKVDQAVTAFELPSSVPADVVDLHTLLGCLVHKIFEKLGMPCPMRSARDLAVRHLQRYRGASDEDGYVAAQLDLAEQGLAALEQIVTGLADSLKQELRSQLTTAAMSRILGELSRAEKERLIREFLQRHQDRVPLQMHQWPTNMLVDQLPLLIHTELTTEAGIRHQFRGHGPGNGRTNTNELRVTES
jgi:hypothetical protein